jgi:hypothetical protein
VVLPPILAETKADKNQQMFSAKAGFALLSFVSFHAFLSYFYELKDPVTLYEGKGFGKDKQNFSKPSPEPLGDRVISYIKEEPTGCLTTNDWKLKNHFGLLLKTPLDSLFKSLNPDLFRDVMKQLPANLVCQGFPGYDDHKIKACADLYEKYWAPKIANREDPLHLCTVADTTMPVRPSVGKRAGNHRIVVEMREVSGSGTQACSTFLQTLRTKAAVGPDQKIHVSYAGSDPSSKCPKMSAETGLVLPKGLPTE